jgi:hypothetical protein
MKRARPPRSDFERAIWYLGKFRRHGVVEILFASVDPADFPLIVSELKGYLASLSAKEAA